MGLLDFWKSRTVSLTDADFWAHFFGLQSSSGKAVTAESALQLATFWAATRTTSQAVAQMAIGVYERSSDGARKDADGHPVANILWYGPNDEQTPYEFWQGQVAWMLVRGNCFSEKREKANPEDRSQPLLAALEQLPADKVDVKREDGELVYDFNDRGKIERLPADKILHIRGFGFGGDCGLSVIRFGVQSLGAALATDETAGKMFGNGLQASGVLSSDQVLKPDQRKQLQEVMKAYSGSTNAGKLMILEAGLQYKQLTLNPEDAQMLETRRFHIEEICRWFGIPPIIIGHAAQGQTMWGTGVEAILLSWLTVGLNPILRAIEERLNKDLFRADERRKFYVEFNRESLLQADSTAKINFLSGAAQNGLMTRNEARAKLNLPRVDGGDELTAQTNLAPIGMLGQAAGGNAARDALKSWLGIEEKPDASPQRGVPENQGL